MNKKHFLRTLLFIGSYIFFFKSVHLIFLTIVTSLHLRFGGGTAPSLPSDALQKVDEILQANQILLYGLSCLIYLSMIHALQPLTSTKFTSVFQIENLKRYFPRYAISGMILTMVYIAGGLLAGYTQYLGVYFNLDEIFISLGSVLFFTTALFCLIFFEEYLLRHALDRILNLAHVHWILQGSISTIVFLFIKYQQFELKLVEFLNLGLLNLVLFKISKVDKTNQKFLSSASFCFVFLFSIHILFGLPLFGQEIPGIILFRCTTGTFFKELVSGAQRGPENSLLFSLCMGIYLLLPSDIFQKLPKRIPDSKIFKLGIKSIRPSKSFSKEANVNKEEFLDQTKSSKIKTVKVKKEER